MLDRDSRVNRHLKSNRQTLKKGLPSTSEGANGDITIREVSGTTQQYVKNHGKWNSIAGGDGTAQKTIVVTGTSGVSSASTGAGGSDHSGLDNLSNDDHSQYVHNTIARTVSANHAFTGVPTFTGIDINGGDIASGTVINKSPLVNFNTGDVTGSLTLSLLAGGTGDLSIGANKVTDPMVNDNVATGLAGSGMTATSGVMNVIGGTSITANAGEIRVTDGSITDTQLAYDTGQHLTTGSTPSFSTLSLTTSLTTPRIISSGDITLEPAGTDVLPLGNAGIDMGDYNRMWRTLYASELYVETLVAQDVLATIGGRIMVAPTTKLIADLSSSATTIDVEHNNLTGKYVIMKTAPGGMAQTETFKISGSSPSSITGGYRYNITSRNLDGTGANAWVEGDAACSVGGSVGEGFIDLTSTSTVLNHAGPTMAIYARTGTGNWNDLKPTVAVGQLSSFVDYSSSDKFGIAIGNDITLAITNGFKGLTADNTNGLRMFNTPIELYSGAEKRVKISSDGTFKIGRYIDNSNSGTENNHLYWNGTSLAVKGDIEMGSGSTINWGNVTESGTVPYRANNWSPDLTAYATNSALSSYALTSSLSAYMQVTPSSSTNIGSNYVYTGTLIAGQINTLALNADYVTTGTLAAGRISAGSIRTDKLTAGGANLAPNPEIFNSWVNLVAEGWSTGSTGGTSVDGYYNSSAINSKTYNTIRVGGNGYAQSPLIQVDPSQTYRLKVDMTHDGINSSYYAGNFGVLVRFYDANQSQVSVTPVNGDGATGTTQTGVSSMLFTSGYMSSSQWISMDRVLFPPNATQTQMRGGGNRQETEPTLGAGTWYSNNYKMLNTTRYIRIFLVQESTNYRNSYFGNISFTPIGAGLGEITGSKIRTAATGKRIEIDGESNNFKLYDSSGDLIFFIDDDVYTNAGVSYPGIRFWDDNSIIQMYNTDYSKGWRANVDNFGMAGMPEYGVTNGHFASNFAVNHSYDYCSFTASATNSGSGSAYGMYISAGSAAKPNGGSWATASDSRVKTVGDNYATGLSDLIQLEPKYYKYNGKADGAPDDGVDYVGLIAQEAEVVIPSLVSKGTHEIDDVEVDDFRMMDTSELQYALINAVKELNTRLTALEG